MNKSLLLLEVLFQSQYHSHWKKKYKLEEISTSKYETFSLTDNVKTYKLSEFETAGSEAKAKLEENLPIGSYFLITEVTAITVTDSSSPSTTTSNTQVMGTIKLKPADGETVEVAKFGVPKIAADTKATPSISKEPVFDNWLLVGLLSSLVPLAIIAVLTGLLIYYIVRKVKNYRDGRVRQSGMIEQDKIMRIVNTYVWDQVQEESKTNINVSFGQDDWVHNSSSTNLYNAAADLFGAASSDSDSEETAVPENFNNTYN